MPYSMTVYSMQGCAPCTEFKEYLDRLGANYLVKDVTNDTEAQKEFRENGFIYTPTSIIEVDGEKYTIIGANKQKIEELLGIQSEQKA
ncbi:glutaredoxin family protein [Bacillus sp. Brlt_9]|uniref:glutaredoxin family protein n=1 Tax=Bacillus sp. Brlt_9 TaxID=3110916 RepID=UPI003F7C8FE4